MRGGGGVVGGKGGREIEREVIRERGRGSAGTDLGSSRYIFA